MISAASTARNTKSRPDVTYIPRAMLQSREQGESIFEGSSKLHGCNECTCMLCLAASGLKLSAELWSLHVTVCWIYGATLDNTHEEYLTVERNLSHSHLHCL